MKQFAIPLVTRGATTLSSKPGRFANRYDNIWVEPKTELDIQNAGIVNFPKMVGWNHKKSRKHVSDHAPIYMTLGSATLSGGPIEVADVSSSQPGTRDPAVSPDGIRGNKNSKIYHRPDCPSYSRVGKANRVPFKTARDAKKAGYRVAGNCP